MAYGHHPDVERWRPWVNYFFGMAGFPDETEYALMVMWGESGGRPDVDGPTLASGARARGLYQHLDKYWNERVYTARQYWSARGVEISTDPYDPVTNIAVAAWLRAVGGWGHWAVTYDWYKEGAWGQNTYWDGYQYQNLAIPSTSTPPRGDGRIGSTSFSQGLGFGENGAYPYFVNPLPGANVTGHWGDDRDGGARSHQGIDMSAAEGTPMRASMAGRVSFAGYRNDMAGYTVIVDHGNGWSTKYMHVRPDGFLVNEGDMVAQGQHIALVGASGNAQGPHLHFQIEKDETPINPELTGVIGNLDPSMAMGFGFGFAAPPEPETPRSRARMVLGMTIDAISRAVAGGQRVAWSYGADATQGTGPAQLTDTDDPGEGEGTETEVDERPAAEAVGRLASQLGAATQTTSQAMQEARRIAPL